MALLELVVRISTKKSCILVARLPACVIGVLAPFALLDSSGYLGVPLKITESADHLMTPFCPRASVAFLSNRPMLVNPHVPLSVRLRMFNLSLLPIGGPCLLPSPKKTSVGSAFIIGLSLHGF